MKTRRCLLGRSLPAGLTAFCWLSMRTTAHFSDESLSQWGFPLGWLSPDPISSGGHVVAVAPLILDIVLFVAAAAWACARWGRRASSGRLVAATLWLAAVVSLLVNVAPVFTQVRFVGWQLDGGYSDGARKTREWRLGTFDLRAGS